MKKLIIILSVFSFTLIQCHAQERFVKGKEYRTKHDKLKVTNEYKPAPDAPTVIFINSVKNKYDHGIPHPSPGTLPIYRLDIHVNKDQIKEIVYEVLKNKIKELHDRHEIFDVLFVFEINGDLTDTNYTLVKGTLITPEEIDAIDIRLRTEIKATFTGKDYINYKAINYSLAPSIRF